MLLRYIYTLFVGIFLAIFIGIGISVFYESPRPPSEPSWYFSPTVGKYEPTEEQKREEVLYSAKMREFNETTMSNYNRNVSIIILGVAVIVLALSLLLDKKLGIVADGILLGGIFTLLYGIARGVAVDSSKYRFLVATIGLVTTLVLGYVKFAPVKDSKKV